MTTRMKDYSAWYEHKDFIHKLYVLEKKSQGEVLNVITKPPYSLEATPAQFERILAEELKITKNLKGGDWVAIEYHTQKRKRQGLDTIVYINDEPQNAKKLAKQANRYRNRVPENGARSPLLPSGVLLQTPPLSPAAIHGTEAAVNAHVVGQNVMTTIDSGVLFMDTTFTDITFGLENLEECLPLADTVTNGMLDRMTFSPLQLDTSLADWDNNVVIDGMTDIPGSLTVIDRYVNLLSPSPWFTFVDWLLPKLERSWIPRTTSTDGGKNAHHKEDEGLSVVLKTMGLAKSHQKGSKHGADFISSVIPERFSGEVENKIATFNDPTQAKIQAAEVILSLLANNHKSVSGGQQAEELRKWFMEIPITILELVIHKQDPTATAVTSRLLEWSITQDYLDVFQRLCAAKLNESYLTGTRGGRLLVKALERLSGGNDLVLELLKHKPRLDSRDAERNTPLHLAARRRGPDVLEILVKQGADMSTKNDNWHTPLQAAVLAENQENVGWLLTNGVPLDQLEQALSRMTNVPTFELCNCLWNKYPNASKTLTKFILIYAAVRGAEDFADKVEEVSTHFEDNTTILEEAFCLAMQMLHGYETSDEVHSYFYELNSSDFGEADDEGPVWAEGDVIQVFLDYGVDSNVPTVTDGDKPLALAIRTWTAEEVHALLEHGAQINQKLLRIPLIARFNATRRYDVVKYLFLTRKLDIDYNRRLSNGNYPLQEVCSMHNGSDGFALVRSFIKKGAKINSRLGEQDRFTALHYAVQHAQVNTVRYLLRKGARTRQWVRTPGKSLFEVCVGECPSGCHWNRDQEISARVKIFKLLKEVGAEADGITLSSDFSSTNVLADVMKTWPGTELQEMLSREDTGTSGRAVLPEFDGGKWHNRGPFTPLQMAVKRHEMTTVKLLLAQGASINASAGSKNGGTALQLACARKSEDGSVLEMVLYLLENGADVNGRAAADSGMTALQRACARNPLDFDLIQLLLKHGADVNGDPAKTFGRTALQLACSRDEIDMALVRMLVEQEADINAAAAPTKGITALQGAVVNGNIDLVAYLLEKGAQVDLAGAENEGRTAIEAAAEHGRLVIAGMLLNASKVLGISLNLLRAVQMATEEGHYGVVKLFEDHLRETQRRFSLEL
ncbi:ankyrin repeat-containing domain protein [Bisporella sp. PMI_857]|nr:ankyrin repeat-containing domain protein [Bisporella sp. PMI_857]